MVKVLWFGGVVVVFFGGDYDVYWLIFVENVIDFNGCKGYVSIVVEVGVFIVLVVFIGG